MADGFQNYQNLPQEKRLMFHVRMDALMIEYQKQFHLYQQGAWDWPTREKTENAILRMLVCPGGRAWWEETGEIYHLHDHWQKLIESKGKDLVPLNEYSWLKPDSA